MTVSELRTLVDNLDEYIHIPGGIERLKKMVLHLAVSGQLVPQDPSEGTGEELYKQIQTEKAQLVEKGEIKKQKPLSVIDNEDIAYDIPDSWKWVRLDSISKLITDGTHHTPKYQQSGVPFLSIKDISGGSLDFSKCKYISIEEHDSINERCDPEYGDILFCRIGTLGRPVVVNTRKPFSIFVSLGLIKFPHHLIESDYLRLYLEAPETYRQYSRIMAGGSHTNKLNLVSMKSLITALPPLTEQKRIVKKVDSIFILIERLAEEYKAEQAEHSKLVASSLAQLAKAGNNVEGSLALTHLSEIIRTKADAKILRQTILHLAVSGQLVPQDPSEGTGEELFQQIQAEKTKLEKQGKIKKQKSLSQISDHEKPFAIPESWKWVRIGELSQIDNGNAFKSAEYTDKGLRVVRISNVQDGYIEDKDPKYIADNRIEEFRKYELFEGDMLMSLTGYVGRTAILTKEYLPALLNQRVARIKWGQNIDTGFIGNYLSSMSFMSAALGAARGAAQPNMSTEWLKSYGAPLPPLAEQKRIVAKTTQLLNLITELEKHLEK